MASTTNWVGPFLKSSLCPGQGLIVEGTVKELRSHSVFVRETSAAYDQGDALPTRYIVLVLEIQQAYERIFDKRGDEIDYMGNLKFKKTYIEPTILTHAQVAARIGRGDGIPMPAELLESRSHLFPNTQRFEFWIDVAKNKAKDIEVGSELRITTLGDSIFVGAFAILNPKATDALSGGLATAMNVYKEDDKAIVGADLEGVDEDEWDE